jgi:NTP pyrophosphatase (non-canonical NTP hydrolase)
MTFAEYDETSRQRETRAHGTAYPFEAWHYALGLAGDAGELADKVKAVYRDADGDFGRVAPRAHEILMHELGDVLWHVTALAAKLGQTLEEVARLDGQKRDARERRRLSRGSS